MKLRRRRAGWGAMALFLAIGLFMIYQWSTTNGRNHATLVIGAIVTLPAWWILWRMLRPFSFEIGLSGLDVRRGRAKTVHGWHEIRIVTLSQGADSPVTLDVVRVGSEHATQVLSFAEVADEPDGVAEALRRFGGSRFVDLRPSAPKSPPANDFSIVLRGYDPATVDTLIARANGALTTGDRERRLAAVAALTTGVIPVAMRGYDRSQVDVVLARLVERLSE